MNRTGRLVLVLNHGSFLDSVWGMLAWTLPVRQFFISCLKRHLLLKNIQSARNKVHNRCKFEMFLWKDFFRILCDSWVCVSVSCIRVCLRRGEPTPVKTQPTSTLLWMKLSVLWVDVFLNSCLWTAGSVRTRVQLKQILFFLPCHHDLISLRLNFLLRPRPGKLTVILWGFTFLQSCGQNEVLEPGFHTLSWWTSQLTRNARPLPSSGWLVSRPNCSVGESKSCLWTR